MSNQQCQSTEGSITVTPTELYATTAQLQQHLQFIN